MFFSSTVFFKSCTFEEMTKSSKGDDNAQEKIKGKKHHVIERTRKKKISIQKDFLLILCLLP
jgi:hypothetical protein